MHAVSVCMLAPSRKATYEHEVVYSHTLKFSNFLFIILYIYIYSLCYVMWIVKLHSKMDQLCLHKKTRVK